MAKGGRLHLRKPREPGEGLEQEHDARATGLCGMVFVDVTNDPGLVRCRLCRRRMAERAAPIDPSPLPLPFEPGPPVPLAQLGGTSRIGAAAERVVERINAGDDSDIPRWRSLDAALSMWRRIGRDRSPIRSVPLERESRSEGAVRTTFGRDEWIEVDRLIDRAFSDIPGELLEFAAGTHRLRLTHAEARAVFRGALEQETTATQVAQDLEEVGHTTTTGCVARLFQVGRAFLRGELERKGLVEKRGWRTAAKDEEGQAMAAPAGFDLDGWKEILPLIGMTEATARERMVREDDPLPITPWSGRVISVRSELEAWVRREAAREREARRKSA